MTSFPRTLALLAAATTAVAAAALAGPVHELARQLYPTGPHAPTDPPGVLELFAHNAVIAAIPGLLVLIRWHTHPTYTRTGTLLIAAVLGTQAVAIGLGIGAWPAVLSYLPHLPVELAALAAGTQLWRHAHHPQTTGRWALATVLLLAAAAVIEVLAAPGG